MKSIITILLLGIGLSLNAQIKLKKFDDRKTDAVESIIFNFSETTNGVRSDGRKEFNIQENNPFNRLSFEILREEIGSKIYKIDKIKNEELKGILHAEELPNINYTAKSTYKTFIGNEKVAITYNLLAFPEADWSPIDKRKSVTYILNSKGQILNEIPLDYDVYDLNIDESGSYLAIGYGAPHAHSTDKLEYGFSIRDLETLDVIYEEKDALVYYSNDNFGTLRFNIKNRTGNWLYVVDDSTRSVYRMNWKDLKSTVGKNQFKLHNDQIVGLENFQKL